MSKSILIAGDFAPVKDFNTGEEREFIFSNGLKDLFESADLSIANLECPLTSADDTHRIVKDGPNMKCDKSKISLLKVSSFTRLFTKPCII